MYKSIDSLFSEQPHRVPPRGKNRTFDHQSPSKLEKKGNFNQKAIISMGSSLKKILFSQKRKAFQKINRVKNYKQVQEISFRFISVILKFKQKREKIFTMNKLKENSLRQKMIINFLKLFASVAKSSDSKWKLFSFEKLKIPLIRHRGMQGSMVKINEILNPPSRGNLRRNLKGRNLSTTNLFSQPGMRRSLRSTSRLPKQQINQDQTFDKLEKTWKINEFKKSMELSPSIKQAFQKIKKIQVTSNLPNQILNPFKDAVTQELRRLEGIKTNHFIQNQSKVPINGSQEDNQLTLSVIHHLNRIMGEIQKEKKELAQAKILMEKEAARRKEENFLAQQVAKKKRNEHFVGNQVQMKRIMDQIDQFLRERQYSKAHNKIKLFLSKYETQEYAKDRVHYFQALDMSLANYDQMKKCMDETGYVLQVLSLVDLTKTDTCLRTLKANHKQFNYLRQKYLHNTKFHGKQMGNILHNLRKFNDDIISYLQVRKDKEKSDQKQEEEKIETRKRFEAEIEKKQKMIQLQHKKIAPLDIQLEKAKKKIEIMQTEIQENKYIEKRQTYFCKKISTIIDKMNKNYPWQKDYEHLKKDIQFVNEKPYGQFFLFTELFEAKNQEQVQNQIQALKELHEKIGKVFHQKNKTNREKFDSISKLLDLSVKKQYSKLFEIHNSLQLLMVTITGQTVEVQSVKRLRTEHEQNEKKLSQSEKKLDKLSDEVKYWKQKSEKSESRNSTPQNSRVRRKSIKLNELETIQELIPKLNVAVSKPEHTVQTKINQIDKILSTTSMKNSMTKRANDLMSELLRNILFQADDSPAVYRKKKRNSSHESLVMKRVSKDF